MYLLKPAMIVLSAIVTFWAYFVLFHLAVPERFVAQPCDTIEAKPYVGIVLLNVLTGPAVRPGGNAPVKWSKATGNFFCVPDTSGGGQYDSRVSCTNAL